MENIEKLRSLAPERRRQVIKILLDHARELQMLDEVELLSRWLDGDPDIMSAGESSAVNPFMNVSNQ